MGIYSPLSRKLSRVDEFALDGLIEIGPCTAGKLAEWCALEGGPPWEQQLAKALKRLHLVNYVEPKRVQLGERVITHWQITELGRAAAVTPREESA